LGHENPAVPDIRALGDQAILDGEPHDARYVDRHAVVQGRKVVSHDDLRVRRCALLDEVNHGVAPVDERLQKVG
jgi:hypothetical protein